MIILIIDEIKLMRFSKWEHVIPMYLISKCPSKKLLYEDVINSIYDLIDRNDFKLGDQLPSERELTEATIMGELKECAKNNVWETLNAFFLRMKRDLLTTAKNHII